MSATPERPEAPILELRNVSRGFGNNGERVEILDHVNLQVQPGEFVAIVGFSGSGKTTLINLLAGLLKADSGEVLHNGKPMEGPGPDRGMVFQNYSLLPWFSVLENVQLALDQVSGHLPESERRDLAMKFITLVNLAEARDKRPAELSGGMRQRVSVARALAMQPEVLLLDEPLGALDALTRATLQDELARLRQSLDRTIVLITNDPDEALYLADRIIPLTSGPRATLGPSYAVPIPHPRNRKTLALEPAFRSLRREITDYLLASRSERSIEVTRKLDLPDLEPEDLSVPRRWSAERLRREQATAVHHPTAPPH